MNTTKVSFSDWLKGQAQRDDGTGDVARDYAVDLQQGGKVVRTPGDLKNRSDYPIFQDAVDRAALEWRRLRNGNTIQTEAGQPVPDLFVAEIFNTPRNRP